MHDSLHTNCRPKPWNKGKLIGQKLPLKQREIWRIRANLECERNVRELAMFDLAIDSKLRACDLMALRVRDVLRGDPDHWTHGGSTTQDTTSGPLRDHRPSAPSARHVDQAHASSSRQLLIPQQVQEGRSPINTPVREDRWQVGDVHPTRPECVWHPHDATH